MTSVWRHFQVKRLRWNDCGPLLTSDARLDLFSCSVAAGTTGKVFVNDLAALTGAAVFASTDPVGTVPGADFVWEYHTGHAATGRELFSVQELVAVRGLCLSTVTLTLYMHENSQSGPFLTNALVIGKDGAGTAFEQVSTNGYVTVTGAAGTWSFVSSETGCQAASWQSTISATTTNVGWLMDQSTLSAAQVASYAYQAKFNGGNLVDAIAISDAESSFYVGATNVNSVVNDNVDRGLWQINGYYNPTYSSSDQGYGLLTNPSSNASAAYTIASNGTTWTPWSTFTNGSFETYLPAARTAAAGVDSTVITGIGDSVKANMACEVRSSAGGGLTGTETAGNTGVVIGGYQVANYQGYTYVWWQVQWSDGQTGWSAEASQSGSKLVRIAAASPTVSVTSPAAGAVWQTGTSYTVNWSLGGNTSAVASQAVFLSTNGGSTWQILTGTALSASARSYQFTPTAAEVTTSAMVMVSVEDSGDNQLAEGTSSGTFTIQNPVVAPTVSVTSPAAGAVWQTGTSYTVNWSLGGNTSAVASQAVFLSTNGGSTWQILTGTALSASARSYQFTPTAGEVTTSAMVMVSVEDSGDNQLAEGTNSGTFTISNPATNHNPNTPTNSLPANGDTSVSLTPTLTASAFSDPDSGDTEAGSQWQVILASSGSVVYDSGQVGAVTSWNVPSGYLANSTAYRWTVRYEDNHGAWSSYSSQTSFSTVAATNHNPNTPTNSLPANGDTSVSLTPTLTASAFSDPDSGDTEAGSQWQVILASSGSVVYDSGQVGAVTSWNVPSGYLANSTAYRWTVRYEDNHGAWSSYSSQTSFSTVAATNHNPNTPTNSLPANGDTSVSLTPTLTASAFSDPDSGDTEAGSEWVVYLASSGSAVYDSGQVGAVTSWNVPSGYLANNTGYTWQVRYEDNHGAWSNYSTTTSFTTVAATNHNPNTPTNSSPSNGAGNQSLTPTLIASAFSDPDSGDTQAGSEWQVMLASSGSVVYDSGQVAGQTNWTVPSGYLANNTGYTWQVRYEDNHAAWSSYSTSTSFTTVAATNHNPNTPVNSSPSNGAGNQSLTPTLIASAFSDPDSGDTQAGSEWQVTLASSGSVVYDSGQVAGQTNWTVPSGYLANNTGYTWQVRYEDNHGAWSNYSTTTSFTTVAAPATYIFVKSFGSWGTGNGQFENLQGLGVDASGNIFVADSSNSRIQKFSDTGTYLTQFGSGVTGFPMDAAVDQSGNVFVVDESMDRVEEFSNSGTFIRQFGSSGTGNGQFTQPEGIAVDQSGNVLVADTGNNRIEKFTNSGVYLTQFGSSGTGNGQFNAPDGIAVDQSGNIFVVDIANFRVEKFNSSGTYLAQFGSYGSGSGQFEYPYGLTVDQSGNVFVADSRNYRIQEFSNSGTYVTQFGSYGSGDGQLNCPADVGVDPWGNVFIADNSNSRVVEFAPVGASKVAFTTQPSNVAAGSNITPAVQVSIEDTNGNVVTGDTSTVTLTLSSGTFASGSNTATAVASGGVATFGSLSINTAGTGYTLTASDGSLTGATSSSFSVTTLTPVLSIGTPAAIAEGDTGSKNLTFTVSLSASSSQTVTVNYATSNGTATAGSDYTSTSGTLTFNPGVTSQQINVPILGDYVIEGNETFTVTLSGAVNANINTGTATGTIQDDDVAGTLALSSATYSVNEGGGTVTITVNRSGGLASGVGVNYATSNGTATAGSDYTSTSGTLTFNGGVTSQTFTVPILQDSLVEGNETFNVALSSATGGATLGTPSSAVVTIVDDDVALPVLNVSTTSLTLPTSTQGTAGATTSFTVSGTALGSTDTVNLSAPTGSEISKDGSSFFSSVLLYPDTSGNLSATTVYARISASATANVSGNLTVTDALHSSLDQSITVSGTVNAPANQPPSIGSLSDSPDPVVLGNNLTLTANNVTDSDGTVVAVGFYRDVNGNGSIDLSTDDFLGFGTQFGTTWTWTGATSGFSTGTNTYMVQAEDNDYALSNTAITTGTVNPSPVGSLVVTTALDVFDPNDGLTSLREAVDYANTHVGDDVITFDSSLAGQTITLTNGELDITDTTGTTTIVGLGADQLTVSGNNASRVFCVESGATAEISDLTIANGYVSGGEGGGIYNNNNATLTLTGSNLSGNSADYGGGIGNAGTLTITGCTISGNSASGGRSPGYSYSYSSGGGIENGGTLTITSSIIAGNSAPGSSAAFGGGIGNFGTLTITGSTIAGNSASGNSAAFGGGIGNFGTLTITDSTISRKLG